MRKLRIPVLLMIFFTFINTACRGDRFSLVYIPVPTVKAVDFAGYQDIFYSGIMIKGIPENIQSKKITNNFFVNEFSKVVKKRVSGPVSIDPKAEKRNKSLLISGDIVVNIKKRSIIGSKKKDGKKIRIFKKVENWELEMSLTFQDIGTGKILFTKKMKSILNSADPKRPDYNFRFLFRRVTERFIRRVMRLGKIESRYLLK